MSCIDVDSATHFESYSFPTGLKANQWFEQQARSFLAQKLYPDGTSTRCSNTEFLQRCEDGVMYLSWVLLEIVGPFLGRRRSIYVHLASCYMFAHFGMNPIHPRYFGAKIPGF